MAGGGLLNENLPQVGDNPVGHPELMSDVFYEFRDLLRRNRSDGADFDPLGQLVHCHHDL
jgi:hypothetical protein